MMVSLGIQVRRWQRMLQRWMQNEKVRVLLQAAGLMLLGFGLSAASLRNYAQPLALGLVCSLSGWPAVLIALGGMAGYAAFWGLAGCQGVIWLCLGLPAALLLGGTDLRRDNVLLMPAFSGVIAAGTGLAFQLLFYDDTPVLMYLLRTVLAILGTRMFAAALERRSPVAQWLLCGAAVLALAQLRPIPYLGFGYIAAGALAMAGAFPAAALAGLALDLAQVTAVPMTAVLSLTFLLRLIPRVNRYVLCCAGAAVYLLVMSLCGVWDLQPVAGLLLGGVISLYLPRQTPVNRRRGETGFVQVRLEMASLVLGQTQHLLEQMESYPIDEQALITRAAQRACGSCPCRKSCKEKPEELPAALLHKPLGNGSDLPLSCRKSGRLLQELRRSQEQFRAIRADRDRREEYRAAVTQQYGFLSEYLQDLSDTLSRRGELPQQRYQPELAVCAVSREGQSGDRCFCFAGVECRYYILLCDGMGTGAEAAKEGKAAGQMLKNLLTAGYPAAYALRSVNSFFALQGRAGAVTIDLAELQLDTGKACLYKWGAAPSYVLLGGQPIKIGTATPPPGLSVTDGRETVQRLSLRKGEVLILVSDGAGGEDSLRASLEGCDEPPSELATRILEDSQRQGGDDATVAVVRLGSLNLSAS